MSFWKQSRVRIMLFLAVLGPGFITANVDNDSGGILTYSQAGAQFGYTLLWTMIPITLALIVVQEMCARMGAVTGKGLSDLIREEFGLRMTFVMMILLVIVNFGNVVAEFSGIAGSMQLFHISKYASVPICALIVWALVVKGDYKSVEKIFLIASVFYIAYIVTGVLSGPDWHLALLETVKLPPREVWRDKTYVYMTVGVIGTTITPWMQFYLQSSIVEKGVTVKQMKASRLDVIVGSIFTDVVAWFIVVACAATLYAHGMRNIAVPSDAADAMKPLAGDFAFILFAAGLFNASIFAASILPLSTAYTVCEGLGLESGLDKGFKEAPFFYWFYTALIVLGAAVVLIPNFPLVTVVILSQVLNGVLLPVIMIFMLKLINKHELMGEHTNSTWFNVVAWGTATIVIGLSFTMLWNQLSPPDTLAPSSLTFGQQQLNTASAPQSVALANAGDAPLTPIAATITSGDFTVVNACGNSLAPHSSCSLQVAFVPRSVGAGTGVLSVSDQFRSQKVALTGVGVAPRGASLSP